MSLVLVMVDVTKLVSVEVVVVVKGTVMVTLMVLYS